MTTYNGIEFALEEFSRRSDLIRNDLHYCDVTIGQSSTRSRRQYIHAGAYVHLSAALEQYVKSTLVAVVDEINGSGLTLSDLRLSLFAISCSAGFDSLQHIRGLRTWDRRIEILTCVDETTACSLDTECIPLDGRTIRPQHFVTIWSVFGFKGNSLPGPRHALALKDLADSRNSVAHGHDDPSVVAGRKTVAATLALQERVDETALHLYDAAVTYLDSDGYRR
jgi:hypothetical protein